MYISNTEHLEYLLENKYLFKNQEDEQEQVKDYINQYLQEDIQTLELTIILTNQCNFQCIYCYQEHEELYMSIENSDLLVNTAINIMQKNDIKNIAIHYFGGEPLLNYDVLKNIHNRFVSFVNTDTNYTYESYLTSNVSLLTKNILRNIAFDDIQVTLDGYHDTHHKLRFNYIFNYQNTIDKIKEIIEYSASNVVIRFNICKENRIDYKAAIKKVLSQIYAVVQIILQMKFFQKTA